MKIVFHLALVLVAAVVGLAVGFAFKRLPAPHAGPPASLTTNSVALGSTNNPPPKKGFVPAHPASTLAAQLERNLAMSSGVTRWLCWMDALEKAQPADFARLAKLAKGDRIAARFVATRWAEIVPRHLFDTLVAASQSASELPVGELGSALFNQWPQRDPDAAIAALNEPGTLGERAEWRRQVATTILNKDAERGLQLMSEWDIHNYGPRMNAIKTWAATDPRHAAQFTSEHPAGYASELAMETVGQEWAKTDPKSALAYATADSSGLALTLATTVMKQWAKKDLDGAAQWLASATERTRNRLAPALVESWAKQDATAALSWCEENLQGFPLAESVKGVVTGAAEKNVGTAAAMVAAMEPSLAREEAAGAVAKKWFPGFSSSDAAKPESVAWLSSLDARSIKRVLDEVAWSWATSDPKSMANFLSSISSDAVPKYSDSTLARQMARINPSQALNWAASLPESRALSASTAAFSDWRHSQPEAALKWFEDLPATDARRQSLRELAK